MAKIFEVQDGDYIQLPWGLFEFHNNELHIVTSVNDPAGLSFRGADGSKISWKNARGEEKVLLQLRQNPKGDGEYYFGVLSQQVLNQTGNLDFAMKEVVTINPDQVEFRVPIKASAGIVGIGQSPIGQTAPPPAPDTFPNKIVSPDGRLELDIQNADAPGCVMYFDGKAVGRLLTMEEIAKLSRCL